MKTHQAISRLRRLLLILTAIGLVVTAAIWSTGGFKSIGPRIFFATNTVPANTTSADDEPDSHDDHIDISVEAAKSLGLQLAIVTRGPYTRTIHIPGAVMEKPGQSNLSITSPIRGIVAQIHSFPGQALEPGDLLFTLRVTDEALAAAQLSLLDIISRIAVTEREIERLHPLTETGVVVGRRKLELEYQLKQLHAEQSARLQELKLHGLSASQIERIVHDRELVDQVEIRLNILPSVDRQSVVIASHPSPSSVADRPATRQAHDQTSDQDLTTGGEPSSAESTHEVHQTDLGPDYTLEQLNVFPGLTVNKGDELCHIANHHELYIRGDAFDTDVAHVRRVMEQRILLTAETGEQESRERIDGLSIMYMDNHADPQSQTFPFYMLLPNQVVAEQRDRQGRLFRSWRFQPGQRAHVYLPTETWPDQLVLPRDAIVRSGPETYVFRLAPDCCDLGDATPSERLAALEQAGEWELEPVPVHVLHRDRHHVVLAADKQLQPNDIVVVRHAYQVFLAWKLQLSEGRAHDDDHHH